MTPLAMAGQNAGFAAARRYFAGLLMLQLPSDSGAYFFTF